MDYDEDSKLYSIEELQEKIKRSLELSELISKAYNAGYNKGRADATVDKYFPRKEIEQAHKKGFQEGIEFANSMSNNNTIVGETKWVRIGPSRYKCSNCGMIVDEIRTTCPRCFKSIM